MALVAETVGTLPIDFKTGFGEVMKGADQAAALYGAQQKAEQVKMQLENMRLQQDQMKAGIFLDYMDKISNSPNPAVKKVLQKQAEQQINKMYGVKVDPETMRGLMESPEFAPTVKALMDQIGIDGMGREYADAMFKTATALGSPLIDAPGTIKEAFMMALKEKQARMGLSAVATRTAGTQERFEAGQLASKEEKIKTDIQKTTDPLSAGYNQLLNAQSALKRGDLQGVTSVLSILVKNVGADAGALSSSDLDRFLPKTFEGDLAKVDAYLDNPSDAKVTEDLTKGLRQLVGVAANNMQKRYSERLRLSKEFYQSGQSYKDVDINSLFNSAEKYISDLKEFGGFGQRPGALAEKLTPMQMLRAGYSYERAIKRVPEMQKNITQEEWNARKAQMGIK